MTASLTDEARRGICQATDDVFQRAVFGLNCPFKTREQVAAFWYAGVEPDLVAAFKRLRDAGCALRPAAIDIWSIRSTVNDAEITFRIDRFDEPGDYFVLALSGAPPKTWTRHMVEAAGVEYQAFMDWIELASSLDARIITARQTLRDILNLANTSGQLRRMVPDLAQYLPQRMRESLAEQQRNSQLPPEWTNFDRTQVSSLVETLATCYLLPHVDNHGLNYINRSTWSPCWARRRSTSEMIENQTQYRWDR